MTTWEEIRDEVAGMLADGKPLEDVISKLEKRKNEMAKAMTNEEWFCNLSTEEKARWIAEEKLCRGYFIFPSMEEAIQDAMEWLKQPHTTIKE